MPDAKEELQWSYRETVQKVLEQLSPGERL
jgi:hypothetical protein